MTPEECFNNTPEGVRWILYEDLRDFGLRPTVAGLPTDVSLDWLIEFAALLDREESHRFWSGVLRYAKSAVVAENTP